MEDFCVSFLCGIFGLFGVLKIGSYVKAEQFLDDRVKFRTLPCLPLSSYRQDGFINHLPSKCHPFFLNSLSTHGHLQVWTYQPINYIYYGAINLSAYLP